MKLVTATIIKAIAPVINSIGALKTSICMLLLKLTPLSKVNIAIDTATAPRALIIAFDIGFSLVTDGPT